MTTRTSLHKKKNIVNFTKPQHDRRTTFV